MPNNNKNMTSKNKGNKYDVEKDCRDLQSLLQKNFDDKFIVVNYLIDNLVPLGENFGSDILNISAKIQRSNGAPTEDLYFVAKTTMVTEFPIDWTRVFKKEIFMYTNIIPFYKTIELKNNIAEQTVDNLVPKLYGHRLSLDSKADVADEDAVILLENLKTQGYYILDKKIGLDIQHSTTAMKALAKFHALGIVAKIQCPAEFERIKVQTMQSGFSYEALDTGYDNLVTLVRNESRFQRYAKRIEKIAERLKGGWKYELVTHEDWSTIAHGDFWTNNIMFHNDEATGNVDHVKFLDFQTYRFVDIFVDLAYFLGTSLDDEVKLNRFDELLDHYYETFVGILRSMGLRDLSAFSRKEFDKRFKEVAGNEFLHSALALSFFTADIPTDDEDRKNLFAVLLACRGNDLFYRKLTHLFQIYEKRDWLH